MTKRAPIDHSTRRALRGCVRDAAATSVLLGRAVEPMCRAAFVAFVGMYLKRKQSLAVLDVGGDGLQLYVLPPDAFARECLVDAGTRGVAEEISFETDLLFLLHNQGTVS